MMKQNQWSRIFEAEIQQAEEARRKGNEGMARVCARRAAGAVVGEYFLRNNLPDPNESAYDRLRLLRSLPDVSDDIKDAAGRLIERVTPEHKLPNDADLIAEARRLREQLLAE
jgi:hypothetical protein